MEQAGRAIQQRIAARTRGAWRLLPSIRTFAETLGISKSTVVEASARQPPRRGGGHSLPARLRLLRDQAHGPAVAGRYRAAARAIRRPALDFAAILDAGDEVLKLRLWLAAAVLDAGSQPAPCAARTGARRQRRADGL